MTTVASRTVVRADTRSGHLVRSIAFEPAVVLMPAGGTDLNDIVDRIATEQGVETHLVHSVIRAESNYNANALSPKGAQGIMQLIPATARRFGVANTFDPAENIRGGVRYLRFLLDYYQGDYPKTIAAYNAGEAAVDKYKGIPPYAETQNYVYQVARNLKAHRAGAVKSIPPAPDRIASSRTPDSETQSPIQASIQTSIQTTTGSDGRVYYRTP